MGSKQPTEDRLPAMALEEEESVLGAILLQYNAPEVLRVTTVLRGDHFYSPKHNHVYSAIRAIIQRKEPVDLRTVARELKGKIDSPASFIAELSNKVSQTTNIESHVKVVIECYIKREVAKLANHLSQQAFDDTSDALELLHHSIEDLTALQTNSVVRSDESKIKDAWKELIVKTEPPLEPTLIKIGDTEIATPENHHLVTGEKKSRKSLFVVHELDLFFKQNPGAAGDEVAIFDTEQGKRHVWKYWDRVKRLTGKSVTMFYLRGRGFQERREIIEHTIRYWPNKIKLVVIDGVRDLVCDINDPKETTRFIEWMEALILKSNIHIINVLHLNKTDGNVRGHLGSELQNKGQAAIKIELDKETMQSIVVCENSRDRGFDKFSFTHGEDGLPLLTDMPVGKTTITEDDRRNRLLVIFADGPMKYRALIDSIKDHFTISIGKARSLLAECMRAGWIVKSGVDKAPTTVYKLMITAGYVPPMVNGHDNGIDPAQMELIVEPEVVDEDGQEELPFM